MLVRHPARSAARRPARSIQRPISGANANIPAICALITNEMSSRRDGVVEGGRRDAHHAHHRHLTDGAGEDGGPERRARGAARASSVRPLRRSRSSRTARSRGSGRTASTIRARRTLRRSARSTGRTDALAGRVLDRPRRAAGSRPLRRAGGQEDADRAPPSRGRVHVGDRAARQVRAARARSPNGIGARHAAPRRNPARDGEGAPAAAAQPSPGSTTGCRPGRRPTRSIHRPIRRRPPAAARNVEPPRAAPPPPHVPVRRDAAAGTPITSNTGNVVCTNPCAEGQQDRCCGGPADRALRDRRAVPRGTDGHSDSVSAPSRSTSRAFSE